MSSTGNIIDNKTSSSDSQTTTFSPQTSSSDSQTTSSTSPEESSTPPKEISDPQTTSSDPQTTSSTLPKESSLEKTSSQPTTADLNNPGTYFGFFAFFIYIVFITILLWLWSVAILYASKVATANVLPTNKKCYPYTSNPIDITPISVDVDITYFDGEPYSTKINFPFNEHDDEEINEIAKYNRSNFIIDWIRRQKETYNSWGIKMFYISVLEETICKIYSIINYIFFYLNHNLYEIVILFFGPTIFSILGIFITFYIFVYTIYLWFAEFGWFFKQNINKDRDSKPEWIDVSFINITTFCISCIIAYWTYIFIFFVYLIGFSFMYSISHTFFIICFLSTIMMASAVSEGENMGNKYGIISLFLDVLTSKNKYIMLTIGIGLIFLILLYFGGMSALISLIIFIIIMCFIFFHKTFSRLSIPIDSTAGLADEEIEQAKKICKKPEKLNFKGGFINNIFGNGNKSRGFLGKLRKLGDSFE